MKKLISMLFVVGCHSSVTQPPEPVSPCRPPDGPTEASCPADWTTSEVLSCVGIVDEAPPKGCMKLDGPGYLVCCCEGWGDEFSSYDCGVVA